MSQLGLIQEYARTTTTEKGAATARPTENLHLPLTFTLGSQEASVEYCRNRGIHPALYRPVLSWPNLTGYGVRHGYQLVLVNGWSEIPDHEKIIQRARLFGFSVVHAV